MPRDARRLAIGAALFVIVLIAGAWPSAERSHAFSFALSEASNLVLAGELGHGVSAQLAPLALDAVRGARDNVSADTLLTIRVARYAGELQYGMALRRDAYLPLVLLV